MLLLSLQSFSQNGFSMDIQIDSAENVLKNYYKKNKNNPEKKFLTDNTSSDLSKGFLFRDIEMSTFELFAANFSFSDKDQVQKISFQPFKLLNSTTILSKALGLLKLTIVQKKDITTFGIGIGASNESPYSKKSSRLLKTYFDNLVVPEKPEIFDNRTYNEQRNIILDSLINFKKDTVLGKLLLAIVNQNEIAAQKKAKEQYMSVLEKFKQDKLDKTLMAFDEARVKNVFSWNIGYSSQFFSILGAKGTANNFDSINYYSNKASVASANLSYSYLNGCFSIALGYNYIDSRLNAAKNNDKIKYNGYSFFINKRVLSFLNDSKLKNSQAYKNSLFIPCLKAGFAWEVKNTNEKRYSLIEGGIKRSRSFSPFIDILISPVTQFRISIPFQKNSLVDGSKLKYLGTTVQYSLKFSNLN